MMRTQISHSWRQMTALLFALLLLGFPGLLAAEFGAITSVHGHSGHVEYPDRVISEREFLGWGLDFEQSSGLWNWIHYSIPVPWGTRTRYLGVRFETGSIDAFISDLHVYDGGSQIHSQGGLNLSEGPNWYVLDMGEEKLIDEALGLSIRVAAGVEMMSHRVIIYAVAADWR